MAGTVVSIANVVDTKILQESMSAFGDPLHSDAHLVWRGSIGCQTWEGVPQSNLNEQAAFSKCFF